MQELETLKKSYEALRADYTKKCMELGELKRHAAPDEQGVLKFIKEHPDLKKRIACVDAEERQAKQPPRVMAETGTPDRAQPKKPASLKEAAEMAVRLISD